MHAEPLKSKRFHIKHQPAVSVYAHVYRFLDFVIQYKFTSIKKTLLFSYKVNSKSFMLAKIRIMVIHVCHRRLSIGEILLLNRMGVVFTNMISLACYMSILRDDYNTVKLTYNEHGYCEFTFITKFSNFPGQKCA